MKKKTKKVKKTNKNSSMSKENLIKGLRAGDNNAITEALRRAGV